MAIAKLEEIGLGFTCSEINILEVKKLYYSVDDDGDSFRYVAAELLSFLLQIDIEDAQKKLKELDVSDSWSSITTKFTLEIKTPELSEEIHKLLDQGKEVPAMKLMM